ncbi:MAG: zinc ribbon domain-containing protein [Clostridiales bacterium]|nr:zinc ribbon domain-containing protein [Clostridiales bacterium]
MKCPQCGHWNRDSFPRCFQCGAELPKAQPSAKEDRRPVPPREVREAGPGKIYIQINEEGRATPAMDARDQLARDMENLVERKRRGEEQHKRLARNSIDSGIAPSGRSVQTLTGRRPFPIPQSISYEQPERDVGGSVRPDAIQVSSPRIIGEEYVPPTPAQTAAARRQKGKRSRVSMTRRMGVRRFLQAGGIALALLALGAAVWFVGLPLLSRSSAGLDYKVSPSIYNELPSHLIQIAGEEGQNYWIKELKKSYIVVGGYASFEVPDYTWYESSEGVTEESVTATITPFLKTAAGEQKQMEQITYQVDVPLSTLNLLNPSSAWDETSTALYNIRFEVAKNSTVLINGEDFSDLVNTQDGLISYNASVAPIGDNVFTIVTRSPYYRENSVTVTIYRAPQEIRLDLAADIATRWSPTPVEDTTKEKDSKGNYPLREPNMTVKGTTVSWADITVKTPYANLDLTQLRTKGEFSFEAIFDKIGPNTIIIEASAPGYETSVVKHEVYYVPVAAIYTRKAWDMNAQYFDYLNNSEKRIENTQIYLCKGEIVQILSEKPQMAVMKLDSSQERTVLLRNYTNDRWAVGMVGRVFADAYGVYDGTPWLNGRYSYLETPK